MPAAYRVPMSATRAKILDGSGGGITAYLHSVGSGNVYLGDETVTAATGFELPPNTIIGPVVAHPGYDLYGVRQSGTSSVHVLQQRRW
jgi:hypothetical protein